MCEQKRHFWRAIYTAINVLLLGVYGTPTFPIDAMSPKNKVCFPGLLWIIATLNREESNICLVVLATINRYVPKTCLMNYDMLNLMSNVMCQAISPLNHFGHRHNIYSTMSIYCFIACGLDHILSGYAIIT